MLLNTITQAPPAEQVDVQSIALAFILGAFLVYTLYLFTRKNWFLETMGPRSEYLLGREKKLIVSMNILDKTFNGVKAGKYTLFLTHGTLGEYSKPILSGKIEEVYSTILAETLLGRKLVVAAEKLRFLKVITRLPEFPIKNYLVTGELVPPTYITDMWAGEEERIKAFSQMKYRGLISSRVLWVKPYPPESKLKEIMRGVVTVPDLLAGHEKDLEEITRTYRNTLVELNTGLSSLLTSFIPLARHVVSSVSDPTFVLALIIADRATQISGIGLAQLAEKGGMEGFIQAARQIMSKREEMDKIFKTALKPEEAKRIEELAKSIGEMKESLKVIETLQVTVAELSRKVGGGK